MSLTLKDSGKEPSEAAPLRDEEEEVKGEDRVSAFPGQA